MEAGLVPVHTTLDPNPNGVAEILRCPVADGGKEGELDVTIFLQDPPATKKEEEEEEAEADKTQEEGQEKAELLRVVVPRATRTTGYFTYR